MTSPAALYGYRISPDRISLFPFLFYARQQSGKYSSCKTGREVSGHSRGTKLAPCRYLFSTGTELQPQVPPQGPHRVSWPLEPKVPPVALAGVTPHLLCSSVLLFPTRTMICIHQLAPSYDLNVWSWGQQKCANVFGKSSCSVCADLCRSLTLHRRRYEAGHCKCVCMVSKAQLLSVQASSASTAAVK